MVGLPKKSTSSIVVDLVPSDEEKGDNESRSTSSTTTLHPSASEPEANEGKLASEQEI